MDEEHTGPEPLEELIESDELQEVLRAAERAAWERIHDRVEGLHLLYALLTVENMVAVIVRQMVADEHLSISDLLIDVNQSLGRGSSLRKSGEIPLSPEALLIQSFADNRTLTVGVPVVCCDMLMLGIFRYGGKAVEILTAVGVTEAKFKRAHRIILGL